MNKLLQNKILVIAYVAFFVRLLFVLIFPGPNYFEGISHSYIEVAENILQGKGVVTYVDVAPLSSASPHWTHEPFFDRPLGYVFLILLPYAIVSTPVGIQLLHAILSALSAVLLYQIGQKLFSERTAWWGALLYAAWPLSARFEIALLPDAVMPFFLLLTLWCLLKAVTSARAVYWYFLSGVACGIGMTMRPDILLLPLFLLIAFPFLKSFPKRFNGAIAMLLGIALIIGAHTARNYAVTGGKIVPLGLGNGISMWEGISQFGDTLGTVYGDEKMAKIEGYRSWAYPDGIERDRKRFKEAVEIILNHPGWYAGVMVKRVPMLLTPDWIMTRKFSPSLKEFLDTSSENTLGGYVSSYPLAAVTRLALVVLQYITLILAFVAVVKDFKNRLLYLPALVIFYYISIHVPTNTEARYFYPVIPFVILLAVHGRNILRTKSTIMPQPQKG